MKRRDFLQKSIYSAGALAASSQTGQSASSNPSEKRYLATNRDSDSTQPNILFIMTDQQRYDGVGVNGNPLIQTPNLDRLAGQSANFTHTFVQSPVCTPSRACYFTGRYAHAHRNRVNYTLLPRDEKLLPAYLRESGYQTGMVGKLHLYYDFPFNAAEAARTGGFDIVELHDGVHSTDQWSDYVIWRNQRDPQKDIYYRDLAVDVPNAKQSANPFRVAIDARYTDTAWVGERSRNHIQTMAAQNRPFFLFSSFWKPHSPHEVPEPYDSLYNDIDIPLPKIETLEDIRRLPLPVQKMILRGNNPPYDMDRERLQWIYRSYYADITHIDHEVGEILKTLDETGQADNTIVIFCSDHGDQLLEHGLMGKNVFFEASVRVPFMIRYPGTIKPAVHDCFLETVDVLPTLFEMAGLAEPYNCQGRSFVPLLTGEGDYTEREVAFCENIIPEVFGKDRIVFEKGKGVDGIRHPDAKMVRSKHWKYNYYPEGFAELYDLENDPLEQRNVADDPAFRSVADEMKGRILDWLITSNETDQIAHTWLV